MESSDKSYEDNALNVDSYEDENMDQNTNSPSSSQLLIVNETDESDEEDDTEKYFDDLLSQGTLPTGPVQQIATFGKSDASSSFFMYMLAAFRPEDIERYLLAGFDINEADRFGATAIMYAMIYNDQKAEETLLNKGAQKTQERIVIDNQFMFLQIYNAATIPMEPFLLEKVCQVLGCSLELRNEAGETVLLAAVRDSNKNAILNLLEAGALIDDEIIQEAKTNEWILETLQRKKKERLTAAPTFEKLVSGSSVDPACYASSAPFVSCAEPNKELHTNKACPSNAGNDQTECNEQQPMANSVSNIGQATVKRIENTSQESLTERINCEHDNVDISENSCEFVKRDVYNTELDNRLEEGSESLKSIDCEMESTAELSLTTRQDDTELEACSLSKSVTDNNYNLDHIAEESHSRIEIMQTTNEIALTTRQSDSQEREKCALAQNECKNKETDHKVMQATPTEKESGFFSMQT
ncbi:hypothetical protein Bpfe_003210 [Biomphalaria pfeifferi]|uniref:Uncharacterized protein n=1 Tax=Biomphalaria pfeifferi TaxID=112525 RepID=A0AAD8FJB8_BIOPF|nr:hypothetical protein Bpfe_003210 [Biomphalaria pfeifferi]